MARTAKRQRIAVVGSGIVGLSAAFRFARSGYHVICLNDTKPGTSSDAALGYVAPPSVTSVPPDVVLFGSQAYRRFEGFLGDLEVASGSRPFVSMNGYIHVAITDDQVEEIDTICHSWDTAGLQYKRLTGDAARQQEPMLSPAIRAAVIMQDAMNVDPRELTRHLRTALELLNVEMRTDRVLALDVSGDFCRGVLTESGRIDADWVVVSAGSWSNSILGELRIVGLGPTKGQVAMLRARGNQVLQYPISTSNELDMMPRPNGQLLIGTSNEEVGHDPSTTAQVISRILNRALEVAPGIGSYEFVKAYAGFRPCTANRRPVVGPHPSCPNVVVATGHCQNGILMAPLTADAVLDLIRGSQGDGALVASMSPVAAPSGVSSEPNETK